MWKSTVKLIFNNYYLIFGVIIGLFLNFSFIELDCTNKATFLPDFNYSTLRAIIKSNVTRGATSKAAPVRPRYYSTELGIREKLFVGVFTSEEKLQTQTVHVNKTLTQVVDKVTFFMTAASRRKNLNYSGLIGFTEGRTNHRPFQVIKYISDNFLQDYDYYFLMNDYNYLDVRKLRQIVGKVSVSKDVYAGNVVKDGSYCNIDSGIVFSNSVIKAMKQHLEWCVMNAVTSDNSENIGRCVYYSTKLECQEDIHGLSIPTYKLKSFDLEKKFNSLREVQEFNQAVTVYPIINKEDFYLLHLHYSKLHMQHLKKQIADLSLDLTEYWPPGERKGSTPATRFDLPHTFYFNRTHVFAPDDFITVRRHKRAELLDIEYVLQEITQFANENRGTKVEIMELVNGYRTFDMSRGLDYVFDLKLQDSSSKKISSKRFAVCKPLGTSEFIPAPYVTENTKVTILLPVEESDVPIALDFLQKFQVNVMDKKEKVLLMLVFLYQYSTPSKGKDDVFGVVKDSALSYSSKYHSEDTKVAWVSIRLPENIHFVSKENYKVLNFVVVDLALKKVGVDSLLLLTHVYSDLKQDFLNRVRMNTVLGFQVFSPIPFRFYNPQIALYDQEQLDINKNNGHFDRECYDFVAFYGKDYVTARKKSKNFVPLTRIDNDIANVINEVHKGRGNIVQMFVEHLENVHCLRAPDMSLKMKYRNDMDDSRENWFLATKTQLAKVVVANSDS